MVIEYKLSEISEVAKQVIKVSSNKILLFYGKMGMGKTTLIKEIVKQLGSKDKVSSPTFSLVNEYHADGIKIFHFDFHRIEDEDEAYDMGVYEYLESDSWCFIEWPEKIKNLLPLHSHKIHLSKIDDSTRRLFIKQ